MRIRLIGVAGGWFTAVVAATAVSWAGVGLVGAQISPAGPADLSQAEVQRLIRLAATSGSPSPGPAEPLSDRGPHRTSSSPTAASTQRSVTTRGGTAVLTCTGATITARSAPGRGYVLKAEAERHASRIEVAFSSTSWHSEIKGSCAARVLTVEVEEGPLTADD